MSYTKAWGIWDSSLAVFAQYVIFFLFLLLMFTLSKLSHSVPHSNSIKLFHCVLASTFLPIASLPSLQP